MWEQPPLPTRALPPWEGWEAAWRLLPPFPKGFMPTLGGFMAKDDDLWWKPGRKIHPGLSLVDLKGLAPFRDVFFFFLTRFHVTLFNCLLVWVDGGAWLKG